MPAGSNFLSQPRTGPSGGDRYRAQRAELRARLAAERAGLVCSLLGIEGPLLESQPVVGEMTSTVMLERIASQEEAVIAFMGAPIVESSPGNRPPTGTFERSLARFIDARRHLLDALAMVESQDLFGSSHAIDGAPQLLARVTQCFWNDASLALRVDAWTQRDGLGAGVGPPELLRVAARAARKELLTTIALVPAEARELPIFEGGRTLPELLWTIIELQQTFLSALARAGLTGIAAPGGDFATADRAVGDAWQSAWTELHSINTLVLRALHGLGTTDFEHPLPAGDAPAYSTYLWARGCLLHDRVHAAAIRADLQLDWPERLLR